MSWNKTKKNAYGYYNCNEIALHDLRTNAQSTSAQTQTTNATVQNATIFNDQKRTVTYQTTTRTVVTHHRSAGITEIQTRRTATPAEYNALMASLNIDQMNEQKNTPNPSLALKYNSAKPSVVAGSNDKHVFFKPTKTKGMPSLVNYKTEETTVTQNSGRTVASSHQEKSIKMNLTNPSATRPKTKKSTDSTLSATIYTPKTVYTSPYSNRTFNTTLKPNIDARPIPTENAHKKITTTHNLSKPTFFTTHSNAQSYATTKLQPSATTSSISSLTAEIPFGIARLNSSPAVTQNIPKITITKTKSNLKPGLMFIFNNENFDNDKNEHRVGSSVDVKSLRETFEGFKLKVETYKDPTLKEIRSVVKYIEGKDFSNRSCLVIVILSHGHRFERVQAKDEPYSIDDDVLFPILRNKTLKNKPKIFFIQACKGSMEIDGLHKDSQQPHGVPDEILKCYSTFEGYVSYRTKNGTYFVQKLCENIQRDGHKKSIEEIMKNVTYSIKTISNEKQIPTTTSTLTKPFIFGDYV